MSTKSAILLLLFAGLGTGLNAQLWMRYSDSASNSADDNPKEALRYHLLAKEALPADSISTNTFLQYCRKIGESMRSSGSADQIIPFYLNVYKQVASSAGKTNMTFISICDQLGQQYLPVNLMRAEPFFTESLQLRDSLFGTESVEFASGCNNLGVFYASAGQHKEAAIYHLRAKSIRLKLLGNEHVDYAQSCNNLANAYWNGGEYEKAESLALEALRIREKVKPEKQSRLYAITCTNLGNIYRDMGQYEKAEGFYLLSKNIRFGMRPREEPAYSDVVNSLGDLHYYMGRFSTAEAFYQDAKSIRDSIWGNESDRYAQSCNNLANLYAAMNRLSEAESLFLQAKQIWEQTLDSMDATNAVNKNGLGSLYLQMKKYSLAEKYLVEAGKIWSATVGRAHPYHVKNTMLLAELNWNINKPVVARKMYNDAFKDQYNQINKIFRFTNEREKAAYISNVGNSADENLSFYYRNPSYAGDAFDVLLLTKSLVLSSTAQQMEVIYQGSETQKKNYDSWIDTKRSIANIYVEGSNFDESVLKELEEKVDSIETILSRTSSAFRRQQEKMPDWRSVQAALLPGECAIEFVQFNYFDGQSWTDSLIYLALLVKKELKNPVIIRLFEQRQIDSIRLADKTAIHAVIDNLYTRGIKLGAERKYGQRIYDLVWKPLEKQLKGVKTIYLTPAGTLHQLSFAAIPVGNNLLLSDRFKLIHLSSSTELLKKDVSKTSLSQKSKLSIFGGIHYSDDTLNRSAAVFPFLSGSQAEVTEITKRFVAAGMQTDLYSRSDGTESALKKLNGNESPGILHIATHGFYITPDTSAAASQAETQSRKLSHAEDPLMRSGLAFANAEQGWNGRSTGNVDDGILLAFEISGMFLPNTKMVVLSACESALGEVRGSEGVFGLQRAFKMAGVPYLLMSLWEVPDRESAEFMRTFYGFILQRYSFLDAFDAAQRRMKNKYRSEPSKWAAWVLVT
ncbi:MAG: CHAT domain-containing protein [Chitinophagaceae bacterium]|nr:CHAT domain-containing protein [Chitinophagaceae bacterium]